MSKAQNIVDNAIQFIVSIEDTSEGFCLKLTDTRTNIIDEVFKSTSFSIVQQMFGELVLNIDPRWFRTVKLTYGTGNTKAIFHPIQQYSPPRGL